MKLQHYFLLTFLSLFLSCMNNTEEYSINASIEGLEEGMAYLAKLDLETNESIRVDSTKIVNGKFNFKGSLNGPYLHGIFLNDRSNAIYLFLENSDINIEASMSKLKDAKITGSKEDALFRSINFDDFFDRKKGMDIMLNNPQSSVSAFAAYYQFQLFNIDKDTLSMIMNNFHRPVKKTDYYKHLSKIYPVITSVGISQTAPNFSIPNENGELVSLNEFKGKYVLLDFWASWCKPCRDFSPELVKANNTFKERNFEIIAISVDKDKERWLKAIEKDSLNWTNLSNLDGWGEISTRYGVKAVPQNFLIDPEGIIIEKNIDHDDLIETLDKVLP